MKKRILWSAFLLSALLLLGFVAPSIYWRTAGTLRGEAFYDGRPTSYWREQIKAEKERRLRMVRNGAPSTWPERIEEWRDKWFPDDRLRHERLYNNVEALPVWREFLRDDDAIFRADAFFQIAQARQVSDLPILVDFLMNDEDTYEFANSRDRGLHSEIFHHYGNDSGPLYYQWLDHDDPKRVERAVYGVRLCGEASAPAIPLLLKRIDAENDCRASLALATIGPKALPALKDALKKDNVHARRHATYAVAAMENAVAERLPLLRQQLQDKDTQVRTLAIEGLGDIARETYDSEAVAALIDGMADSEVSVRGCAIDRLAELRTGAKIAVPKLRDISYTDKSAEIRAKAAKAVAKITAPK